MKKIKCDSFRGTKGWYWEVYEDTPLCRCFHVSWWRDNPTRWRYSNNHLYLGRLVIFCGTLPF